jgi:glycosyltransferase involved in cell wall biosynthesis
LLKEYLFVIAGPESDWTVQELKNQISLEDQKRVIFTNHVDEYEKTWLLYNSGTMLFPSDHENYGISLVEALCTGLPVIASEGVSSSRYIKDFSVGCAMARLDAGEWVGAIHKIYSESNEHQSRILELKARNFFEWRNFAIQVDNFWKNSDKSKVDRKHD